MGRGVISKSDLTELSFTHPCLCATKHFDILITAEDLSLVALHEYLKEMVLIEKKYSSTLLSLAETPILDLLKIQEFDDPYREVKEIMKNIGNSHIKFVGDAEREILKRVLELDKRLAKRLREMSKDYAKIYQRYSEKTRLVEKQIAKVHKLELAYQKAVEIYEKGKSDCESYSTLAKMEMNVKITSNEINAMNNTIQQVKAEFSNESNSYQEISNKYIEEVRELNNAKASVFRSLAQFWLSTYIRCLKQDFSAFEEILQNSLTSPNTSRRLSFGKSKVTNSIVNFIQAKISKTEKTYRFKKFIYKAFNKSENEYTSQRHSLETQLNEMKHYIANLRKFLERIYSAFEGLSRNLKTLTLRNIDISHLNFSERWNKLNNGLYHLADKTDSLANDLLSAKDGILELGKFHSDIYENLTIGENSMELYEAIEESIKNLIVKRTEFLEWSKEHIQELIGNYLKSAINITSTLLPVLDEVDEAAIEMTFSCHSDTHRTECPMYIFSKEPEYTIQKIQQESMQIGEPESADWLNSLLKTFFEEWTESSKFQLYISRRLNKIYNKDRPNYIGEIEVIKVEMGTQAPEMKNFTKMETENAWEFYYELDVNFLGEIKIELRFLVKLVASVLVNIQVVVKSLFGRLQVFYTPSSHGKSWYSFVSKPAVNIGIEPVIGKTNKISFAEYPQLNTFLVSILLRKIRKYVKPNKRSIKIPKGRREEERNLK